MIKRRKIITLIQTLTFHLLLLFTNIIFAKNFDGLNIKCADEIGLLLEFSIPNFKKNIEIEANNLKLFEQNDRNTYSINKVFFQKKSSPIDNTYHFYTGSFTRKGKNSEKIYFEFYPPSHFLIQNGNSPFNSLVCWK